MEVLGIIWSRMNKPLHFLLVGGAVVLFAPAEILWVGYIFAAFGIAGLLEWMWSRWRYSLIFIEQSGVWSFNTIDKTLGIQSFLQVTNRNDDDVIMFSRVML